MSRYPRLMYKGERPWPNERLGTASIVGHTTDTTSRIWVRAGSLGRFRLLYWPKTTLSVEMPQWIHRVPLRLSQLPKRILTTEVLNVRSREKDTTHVFDLDGLSADQEYYYALYWYGGGGEPARIYLGHDQPRFFRTMPSPDSEGPVSFGFYSCHKPFRENIWKKYKLVNDDMWEVLARALKRHSGRETAWRQGGSSSGMDALRFVIGGGDQVYADGSGAPNIWKLLERQMRASGSNLHPSLDEMRSWYRDIYRGYWGLDAAPWRPPASEPARRVLPRWRAFPSPVRGGT